MKYGLEFAGAKRVRRTWGRTMIDVLVLLALSALAGWLLHVLRGAAQGTVRTTWDGTLLAMVAWSDAAWLVIILAGTAWLIVCAVRKASGEREDEDPFADQGRGSPWCDECRSWHPSPRDREHHALLQCFKPWPADAPVPLVIEHGDPLLAVGGNAIPPSEGMPGGMSREDVARILGACADEVKLVRSLVDGAQRSLNVEDHGDALAGAERRLGQLRVTLCELRARFGETGGQSDHETMRWGDGETGVSEVSLSHGLPVSLSSTGEVVS